MKTLDEKRDYLINNMGYSNDWRYKVYSMPEYQVNTLYDKLTEIEKRKYVEKLTSMSDEDWYKLNKERNKC